MINLDEALEPVREMINSEQYGHDSAYQYNGDVRDRWYAGELGPDEDSKALRLDWEFSEELAQEISQGNSTLGDLMLIQLKTDLEDLIENGDIENTSDPLLKVWDGANKRGKQAVDFKILGAHLEKQHRPKKKAVEYTLYLRPYVKWV